jgi:hypothetical protein
MSEPTQDVINSNFVRNYQTAEYGKFVAGVRDELYLVVTPLEGNNGVYGALTFLESD